MTDDFGPHLLGAIPSPFDERDHPLSAHAEVLEAFPPTYIVPMIPWPLNQDGGKCVGFSGALGRALTEWAESQGEVDFSGDDLYIQCVPGDPKGTQGTQIRLAANVLLNTGALVVGGARPAGSRLKIASYSAVALTQSEMKTAVQLGGCWIACSWGNSWFSPVNGVLPLYDKDAGGHAIMIVGWDDTIACPDGTKGAWRLQNSWGASWGQGGRCWLPYSYIGHVWEAWKTFDAPDASGPIVKVLTAYATPRIWYVRAGQTLSAYDPARPGKAVQTIRWPKASSAHTDAEVSVSWPALPKPWPAPSGGPFLRVTDGNFAGLLIVKAEVRVS